MVTDCVLDARSCGESVGQDYNNSDRRISPIQCANGILRRETLASQTRLIFPLSDVIHQYSLRAGILCTPNAKSGEKTTAGRHLRILHIYFNTLTG